MADNSIVNLIQRLEDLIKTIEKAKGTTQSFGEITLSDSIPAQLKDQISLVQRLRNEYLSLIDVVLKGSKLPPLLGTGLPTIPREPVGARFDPRLGTSGRYRSLTTGQIQGVPDFIDLEFQASSGRYIHPQSRQYRPTGTPPYYGQPLLPATTTTGQLPFYNIPSSRTDFPATQQGTISNIADPTRVFEEQYANLVSQANEQLKTGILNSAEITKAATESARALAEAVEAAMKGPISRRIQQATPDIKEIQGMKKIPSDADIAVTGKRPFGVSKQLDISNFLGPRDAVATGLPGDVGSTTRFTWLEEKKLNDTYREGIQLANKYGYSLNDLQSIHKESTTGISRLRFQAEKMPGIYEQLSVTTDRYGNVLQDSQKRFRSFGDTIARNIREVAKWTIAVQLIYGPMRKFQELMTLMVDNEALLADVTISVGRSFDNLGDVFSVAADVAKETGESINGVLQGFELAFRATGSAATETERMALAQQLLYDSMVLSKLSTLDQAEALDTLVGALKQTGRGLDEGGELIDKWVQLSRVANVSVETLAESFAITATAASNAGLTFEELNGIIAVVAENTTLSATEAGNAVRGFIAGVSSDSAVKELQKYGIYVQDAEGNTLGFYDALQQVKELLDAELISSAQFNQLSSALGGRGARRGAQVAATIQNLGDVQKYAEAQANAHGAAEEALSIKLDTTRTKLTELSNSFQTLANSLGGEGGLLDVFNLIVQAISGLTTGLASLTDSMGAALPTLVAFSLVYNQLSTNRRFASLGLGLPGLGGLGSRASGLMDKITGTTVPFTGGRNLGSFTGQLSPQLRGGLLLGGGATALNAGINISQGEWDRAGGNIGGAILGTILAGGNPIGTVIGSAIGDTFVKSVLEYEPTLDEFFKDLFPTADDAEGGAGRTDREQQLRNEIIAQAGFFGTEFGGKLAVAIDQTFLNLASSLAPGRFGGMEAPSRGQVALARLDEDQRAYYTTRLTTQRRAAGIATGEEETPTIKSESVQIAEDYAGLLSKIKEDYLTLIREQIATGDINAKAFKDAKDEAEGLEVQLSKLAAVFGESLIKNVDGINSMTDAIEYMGNVLTNTSGDEFSYITELAATINSAVDNLANADVLDLNAEEKAFEQERWNNAISQAVDYFGLLDQQIKQIDTISFPSIVDLTDITRQGDFETVTRNAGILTAEYIKEGIRLGEIEGTFEEALAAIDPLFARLGGDLGYTLIEGIRSEFLTEAYDMAVEAGEIIKQGLSIQDISDLSVAELNSLIPQATQLAEGLRGIGYEPQYEQKIVLTSEGFVGPIQAEFQILDMLIRDLIDVNEKQLEGIYNLPSDASFYVPFTGYALGQGLDTSSISDALFNIIPTGEAIEKNTAETARLVGESIAPTGEEVLRQRQADLEREAISSLLKEQETPTIPATGLPEIVGTLGEPTVDTTPEWLKPLTDAFSSIGEAFKDIIPSILNSFENRDEYIQEPEKKETTPDTQGGGVIQEWLDSIRNFKFPWQEELTSADFGEPLTAGLDFNLDDISTSITELANSMKSDTVNTNLVLDISSTTLLQLDSQIIANSVKSLVVEELLRQGETATVSRSVII